MLYVRGFPVLAVGLSCRAGFATARDSLVIVGWNVESIGTYLDVVAQQLGQLTRRHEVHI